MYYIYCILQFIYEMTLKHKYIFHDIKLICLFFKKYYNIIWNFRQNKRNGLKLLALTYIYVKAKNIFIIHLFKFQLSIKSAISKFEKSTNLVSLTGMFSRNESLEELSTETLQYLLLPALLGTLSLKLCNQPRKDIINVAEIYFRWDFNNYIKDWPLCYSYWFHVECNCRFDWSVIVYKLSALHCILYIAG